MKKGKKRARTLSLEGLDLFNIGIKSAPLTPTPPKPKKMCLRSLVLNLFTTDFDIKLEKSIKTFRKGTCCLYSYLTDEEKSKIPDFFKVSFMFNTFLFDPIIIDRIGVCSKFKQGIPA